MKYKGNVVTTPEPSLLVVPHGDEMLEFQIRMLTENDKKRFDELVAIPVAPMETLAKSNITRPSLDAPEYRAALKEYNELYTDFIVLTSLSATKELEFETVKSDEPKTWKNYFEELKEAGFTVDAINLIIAKCINVNTLDMAAIERARKDFLHRQSQGR